jgi:flagellar basal body-associated protein FliL
MVGSKGARTGKVAMIAMIAAALVVAGAGGLVMGQKMMHKGKSAKGEDAAKHAGETAGKEEKSADDKTGDKAGEESNEEEPSAVVDLGEFLVNLEGGTESRFLRAEVALRLSGLPVPEKKGEGGATAVEKLPAGDLAVARDCVTAVLSSGVFAQLRTSPGREKLKQDAVSRLQKALPKYGVHEVLFTSFVMQ